MSGKHETGLQLFARLQKDLDLKLDVNFFPNGVGECAVVEFSGPPGSCKSQSLLHILADCLISAQTPVLYIDTEMKFNLLRLIEIMEHNMKKFKSEGKLKIGSEESQLKACLEQLYVMRCISSSQLLVTLHSLEPLLVRNPSPRILMVDSLTSNYWIDRSNGGDAPQAVDGIQTKVLDALKSLHQKYSLTVMATATVHPRVSKDAEDNDNAGHSVGVGGSSRYSNLPRLWQNMVTHRFGISAVDGTNDFVINCSSTRQDQCKLRELKFNVNSSGLSFQ